MGVFRQPEAVARGGTYGRAISYGHCDGMRDGNRVVDNKFAPDLRSTRVCCCSFGSSASRRGLSAMKKCATENSSNWLVVSVCFEKSTVFFPAMAQGFKGKRFV
jgi:hypothetical protein